MAVSTSAPPTRLGFTTECVFIPVFPLFPLVRRRGGPLTLENSTQGSYAGARAAHMRVLYPDLVYGAIASSGKRYPLVHRRRKKHD